MYKINHLKNPSELKGILMEWFSYGDLANYIKTELPKLPKHQQYTRKLQLAQKMCNLSAITHESDMCHLDVKLQQFLVKPKTVDKLGDGTITVRMTDFGSARQRGTILPGPPQGTAIYTAPEQLENKKQQALPSMDCWSLGMSLVDIFYGSSFNKLLKEATQINKEWERCQEESNRMHFIKLCQETINGLPETKETPIIKGLLDPNPNTRWTAEQAEREFAKLLQS
jgi:serine/threonine protein kinase